MKQLLLFEGFFLEVSPFTYAYVINVPIDQADTLTHFLPREAFSEMPDDIESIQILMTISKVYISESVPNVLFIPN